MQVLVVRDMNRPWDFVRPTHLTGGPSLVSVIRYAIKIESRRPIELTQEYCPKLMRFWHPTTHEILLHGPPKNLRKICTMHDVAFQPKPERPPATLETFLIR